MKIGGFIRRWTAAICVTAALSYYPARAAADYAMDPPVLSEQSAPQAPIPPPALAWPGVAVIIIIAIFVAAAVAGPLIQANKQDFDDPQA